MIKKATEYSVVHEGQLLRSVPTPQLKLATIDDVRREMARVYREAGSINRFEDENGGQRLYYTPKGGYLQCTNTASATVTTINTLR